jgi:anthranilate synthase component 2
MSRRILLIDNYDSFVYNLARYFAELECAPVVVRNDSTTVEELARAKIAAIVISPGPKAPADAGISLEIIRRLGDRVPILGVCLGHQAIAAAYGGEVIRAAQPRHGETSPVDHDGAGLFTGLPRPFQAARYHSLIARRETLPDTLRVTAWTDDGLVMGLSHTRFPVHGVQFHPESILTQCGHRLLANFLRLAGIPCGPLPPEEHVALPASAPIDDPWWRADPL